VNRLQVCHCPLCFLEALRKHGEHETARAAASKPIRRGGIVGLRAAPIERGGRNQLDLRYGSLARRRPADVGLRAYLALA
jgi:hypothetical protein